jgi:myo-inositol-1(or 4)-monophosphatase
VSQWGLADVTFTLKPKHEWDVAAGAALVESAGFVTTLGNAPLRCNHRDPLLSGVLAGGPLLRKEVLVLLDGYSRPAGITPPGRGQK